MAAPQVTRPELDRFNAAPLEEIRAALHACCASEAWSARIVAGRPYPDTAALLDAAGRAVRDLATPDVDEALAAHPRIGDRVAGSNAEAQWSRQEQASMNDADDRIRAALLDGNLAYEQRFGTVFLIRAAGRSPAEMLAELRRRLSNDPETERAEMLEQLAQIVRLRVERLLEP